MEWGRTQFISFHSFIHPIPIDMYACYAESASIIISITFTHSPSLIFFHLNPCNVKEEWASLVTSSWHHSSYHDIHMICDSRELLVSTNKKERTRHAFVVIIHSHHLLLFLVSDWIPSILHLPPPSNSINGARKCCVALFRRTGSSSSNNRACGFMDCIWAKTAILHAISQKRIL